MNNPNYLHILSHPRLLQEIDRELATRHLKQFIRQAWHVVEPATPFVEGWHFDALCVHLEAISSGQIRNLLITIPPRHMKSLAVSVFWPCWEWIRWPQRRWLYSSYAESVSIRDSLRCRRLIQSPWYQDLFGHCFVLTGDQNEKHRFENDRSGCRIASSVGGSNTGEGGDRIICDDPHNVHEAESDVIRKGACDWWDKVMATRLNDPKTGAKVIIMQRVHEADLAGHVLAQGGYEHLCLPAEYEGTQRTSGIGWTDPRREVGELLWPQQFGAAQIAELKLRLGSYASAAQLQQRPSPADGGILKRNWWRYYPEPLPLDAFDEIIQSWDLACKGGATSSFVVGQVWGRSGATIVLLDQVRGQWDFPETLKKFGELTARWPQTTAKLVEDKANGPALIATLQQQIPGIVPVRPDGSKEARAHAVSALIESGNVCLPDKRLAPWIDDFVEECAAFPKGAYDDQVDCCTQAVKALYLGWQEQLEGMVSFEERVHISPY
jgi:predicted phage terminase large subunit-like protein